MVLLKLHASVHPAEPGEGAHHALMRQRRPMPALVTTAWPSRQLQLLLACNGDCFGYFK